MAIEHWLQLSFTDGLGPTLISRVVEIAGSAAAACEATAGVLKSVEGIGTARAESIAWSLRRAKSLAAAERDRCGAAGVSVLCPEDEAFPVALATVPAPPPVLYVKGGLEPRDLNGFAIVGSRKCSLYGREQADRFAALLAGAGFTVVSGGARGVDSAAHRGAMSHPAGRTIAVLGCGADVVYPPENAALFDAICDRGAIVTEFPIGTPPLRDNFPRRNRIISGLSRGVLVVEADKRSGALITARNANEDHGRPVFAIPGRIDNPLSAGPHALIRDGAVLVTSLDELLEGLGPFPHGINKPELFAATPSAVATEGPTRGAFSGTDVQHQILNAVTDDGSDVDAIITRSGLAAEIVLRELTLLSLRGAVRRIDGRYHPRS